MEEEIGQMLLNYGATGAIVGVIIFLVVKFAPRYFELKLKKMEEKDYMMDCFKSVVENNTQVIQNNSKVIESNSAVIKEYTANSGKLESKVNDLGEKISSLDVDIQILKERGK